MPDSHTNIVIGGAGWAGLAAAIYLTHMGHPVTLIDNARAAGGRARCLEKDGQVFDNGQHILIGAYKNYLQLLSLMDIPEQKLFQRKRLKLKMQTLNGRSISISCPRLPAPMHMLFGLLTARGLSFSEKRTIIRCWLHMRKSGFRLHTDMPVQQYLQAQHQTDELIKLFWEPLCVATLNTPIEKASMNVYMGVLRRSFTGKRQYSDLLLAKTGLGELLAEPASQYLADKGSRLVLNDAIQSIETSTEQQPGIRIQTTNAQFDTSHFILATPWRVSQKLLPSCREFNQLQQNFDTFSDEPIVTLYLQYPQSISIEGDMIGLPGTTTQWLIDRKSCGQTGLISAVISASGPHMDMDKEALTRQVVDEIQQVFPHWPAPQSTRLIRDKKATFSCTPESNYFRPRNGYLGSKIWLAGDYTDTDLPATLEGAVQSGLECAKQIIQDIQQQEI